MNHRIFWLAALALIFSLHAHAQTHLPSPSDWRKQYKPIAENGNNAFEMRGLWSAKGYGMILEVTANSIRMYHECEAGCWLESMEEPLQLFFRMGNQKDQRQVTLHPIMNPYHVQRIEKIPQPILEKNTDVLTTFELFASTMNDHYAFFDLYRIDWKERVTAARNKLSQDATETDLFRVVGEMLEGLEDAHTRVNAEIDGKAQSIKLGRSKVLLQLRKAFKQQQAIPSFPEFMDAQIERFRNEIETMLDGGKSQTAANRLQWGRIDNVGYIFIPGMGGFNEDDNDEMSQLQDLHQGMDEILTLLSDTDAIILDVSLNGGGMDIFGQAIACHFADSKRLALSKYPASHPELKAEMFVSPDPFSVRAALEPTKIVGYHKPVYVLTSHISVSAAETFVMYMKCLPQVTTVGQPTRGALSDVLEKNLPNGWFLGMSNEVYLDHQGICHEKKGIQPDVELPVFEVGPATFRHRSAIEAIVKRVGQKR